MIDFIIPGRICSPYNIQNMILNLLFLAIVKLNIKIVIDEMYWTTHYNMYFNNRQYP